MLRTAHNPCYITQRAYKDVHKNVLHDLLVQVNGHFEGEHLGTSFPLLKSLGMHGNGVPIVKLWRERIYTS